MGSIALATHKDPRRLPLSVMQGAKRLDGPRARFVNSGSPVRIRHGEPFWGPRRLALELAKENVTSSASAIYRSLLRAGLIHPFCAATRGLET